MSGFKEPLHCDLCIFPPYTFRQGYTNNKLVGLGQYWGQYFRERLQAGTFAIPRPWCGNFHGVAWSQTTKAFKHEDVFF